jgi:hypothetical protein
LPELLAELAEGLCGIERAEWRSAYEEQYEGRGRDRQAQTHDAEAHTHH